MGGKMDSKSKYKVGEKVIIDKVFSTDINIQGRMEKLLEPRVALIEEVDFTSLGPCYKVCWVDKSFEPPRIKYWESDIKSKHRIVKD